MSDLGELLELIYGAAERWRTVRLTLREWHHPGRTAEAIELLNRRQAAGGVRQVMLYAEAGGPDPEEVEQLVRVWLDGDRAREEREGAYAFPTLGVRDGQRSHRRAPTPAISTDGSPGSRTATSRLRGHPSRTGSSRATRESSGTAHARRSPPRS